MGKASSARWLYRFRQGLRRICPRTAYQPYDLSDARRLLVPPAYKLFADLGRADQAHALCVLARVQGAAGASPAVMQAALLHDIGKAGAGLTLFWRTAAVILTAMGLLERAANIRWSAIRRPLLGQLRHAERGAMLCAQAGCDPAVVALVRWHDAGADSIPDASLRQDLAVLQLADDAC